jgi:hypothetical protein
VVRDAAVKHLSQEQLVAFRDGESDESRVREHLASCSRCQRGLDNLRWSLALRGTEEVGDQGEHLTGDELAAFADNALAGQRARSILQHLRSCDLCLASYSRLREADARVGYASPPRGLLRTVRREFAPRRAPGLGTLVLLPMEEGLLLHHRPDTGELAHATRLIAPAPSYRADRSMDRGPDIPHPASARARMQRAGGRRQMEQAPAARLSTLGDERPAVRIGATSSFTSTTTIEGRGLRMEIEAVGREGEAFLIMTVHAANTHDPVRGLEIRLRQPPDRLIEAETDENGRAELLFPPGDSQLEIRGEIRSTLELQHHA